MWDSFKNKNSLNTIELFDSVITFDSEDAHKYKIKFLPLFFIKKYEQIKEIECYEQELCFTGTAHSDRYQIAKKIEKQLKQFDLKMYSYFYLPSEIMYWIRRLFLRKYKYGTLRDFSFKALTQNEIVSIIEKSKVVLDINHPFQCGLTSRCIEALGANRKLITTNNNIKNYNFYNTANILIIDRENPIIYKDFFNTEYKNPQQSIYQYYTLKSWLRNIFNEEKK